MASKRPSVEAALESLILEVPADLKDLGKDTERLRGAPRSTIGGPGESGRPSTHRSVLCDLFSLENKDLNERLKEQDLDNDVSSS